MLVSESRRLHRHRNQQKRGLASAGFDDRLQARGLRAANVRSAPL